MLSSEVDRRHDCSVDEVESLDLILASEERSVGSTEERGGI